MVWWIFLYALSEVAREANAVFVSLQGLTTLVQHQDDRFSGFVEKLLCLSGAIGPLNTSSIRELDCSKHGVIDSVAFSHASAETYVVNLDLWVCKIYKSLTNEQKKTVVIAVARLYLLANSSIQALSLSTEPAPPVTPKGLVAITLLKLFAIINAQHDRVLRHFGEAGIDRISQEFKQLCRDYDTKKPIREAIDQFDHRLARYDEM
ncbi:hypothetical protein PHYPSEUDO_011786 [Phytophthora pseudosyringae]|uniref:Uncharacterized protein n=1 Tax=Phytophthora pseudosyringae TaxID=221518 RepID=A0A8T1W5D6_9STRA|nr:hypothetical protein PHYPSEUDO_011786 [Phytophthora pseudosyringae]